MAEVGNDWPRRAMACWPGSSLLTFFLLVLSGLRAQAQESVKPCSADKSLGGKIEITSEWIENGCRGSIRAVLRFPLIPRTPQVIGKTAIPWTAQLASTFTAPEVNYELSTSGCSGMTANNEETCHAPGGGKSGKAILGKMGPLGFSTDPHGPGSLTFNPLRPEISALLALQANRDASTPLECVAVPGHSGSGKSRWQFGFMGLSIGPLGPSCTPATAEALDYKNPFVICIPPSDCSYPTDETSRLECIVHSDRHAIIPFSGESSWTSPRASDPYHQGIRSYTVHWEICCGCDEKPGPQVHLVDPEPQKQYTFESNNPGTLEVKFKAEVTPATPDSLQKMQDKVLFKMGTIGNAKMEWDPANPGGKPAIEGDFLTAKLKFTGLPVKNDDFGEKKVELLVDGTTMETVPVKIFFPKLAFNHPGGKSTDPNWFYYWQEGNVCGIAPTDIYDGPHGGWGYSKPSLDSIVRLCVLGPMANSGPEGYNSRNAYGSLTVTGVGKGIKCVAETLEHERHHILIYQTYHQAIAGDPKLDVDGDEITAQGEGTLDGIKSDPANGDTFNMGGNYSSYGDNEVRCREVERKLTIKYFPEKDWANPGCQTLPEPYGP
ncbi:MAG: hypothetical protein DLM73_12285 [Chthoniobacterales bacterium]|nr:MAG: hypothetical protein DLM73_12285 [Chthoniobacterales bacterium]